MLASESDIAGLMLSHKEEPTKAVSLPLRGIAAALQDAGAPALSPDLIRQVIHRMI
jgi:hypothetical protein